VPASRRATDLPPAEEPPARATGRLQCGPEGTRFRSGLAVVDATLEPMLTREYRWGRLYNASAHDPRTPALGVSELTALAVDGASRRVVGDRSVIALDGRDATYDAGSNGALVATNVLLSAFAPGGRLP